MNANLHIIIGEDDYLVSEAAKKIVGDGVGLEVIDSLTATNAELQLKDLREAAASFSTPPFLDPRKVTWWKNVHFLPGGGRRESAAEVKEALEAFAEKLADNPLPENQHFVLSGPRLLRTSVFAKRLAAAAELVVFESEKPWKAAKTAAGRAVAAAAERGLAFAPGAAEKFVAAVGTDVRSLLSELDKMRDYLGPGGGAISAADIAEITSRGPGDEPPVWEVTDAIGRRDLAAALAAMRRFESESGFAVMMTTVIEKFFRQLADMAGGRTKDLNAYVLQKNGAFLRNWSPGELRTARARFLLLREKVVSGLGERIGGSRTTSGDVLVVTTLVRVMRRRKTP